MLIRGGGARDLPGSYYSCVRGVLDLVGLIYKRRRRSIYAAPQPHNPNKPRHVSRRLRKFLE